MKKPEGDIEIRRPSKYIPHPKKPTEELLNRNEEEENVRNDKMINIVYNDGQYFLYEP